MGLVAALKKAEETRKAVQSSTQPSTLDFDAERALRRRMRIYPKPVPAIAAAKAQPTSASAGAAEIPSTEPQGQLREVPESD
ncbi:MAG TPA: hypothetical protein VE734_00960 [Terriglobales bacterium]|nr:hypothetical protein [Terriglobales bacterium]